MGRGASGADGEMVFKVTNFQLIDKSQRANAQHRDYSQQTTINFKVAKRLDLKHSHHKKRNDNDIK